MEESKLLSTKQYAELHGLHDSRVRRLILDGRLPAVKIGNQWAISADQEPPKDMRVKSGKYKNWRKKGQE
ncbi:MAG: helix-turn-helix domain-containing protein [Clostridiales bacterium]|nr:helix-turn-helix domain-containing protein [Candidatus Cacconaster stercorequi]